MNGFLVALLQRTLYGPILHPQKVFKTKREAKLYIKQNKLQACIIPVVNYQPQEDVLQ